jgi:hypothetical protein
MPPKINLATILLGGLVGVFRSFVRSRSPLAEVERLLPPLFEAITVVINVNGLWIAKHSDNEQYRQEANRIRKAGFVS